MIEKRTVPSIMTVEGYLETPRMEGAVAILPTEMQLKVGGLVGALQAAAGRMPRTLRHVVSLASYQTHRKPLFEAN
jgi:hypothetical protein